MPPKLLPLLLAFVLVAAAAAAASDCEPHLPAPGLTPPLFAPLVDKAGVDYAELHMPPRIAVGYYYYKYKKTNDTDWKTYKGQETGSDYRKINITGLSPNTMYHVRQSIETKEDCFVLTDVEFRTCEAEQTPVKNLTVYAGGYGWLALSWVPPLMHCTTKLQYHIKYNSTASSETFRVKAGTFMSGTRNLWDAVQNCVAWPELHCLTIDVMLNRSVDLQVIVKRQDSDAGSTSEMLTSYPEAKSSSAPEDLHFKEVAEDYVVLRWRCPKIPGGVLNWLYVNYSAKDEPQQLKEPIKAFQALYEMRVPNLKPGTLYKFSVWMESIYTSNPNTAEIKIRTLGLSESPESSESSEFSSSSWWTYLLLLLLLLPLAVFAGYIAGRCSVTRGAWSVMGMNFVRGPDRKIDVARASGGSQAPLCATAAAEAAEDRAGQPVARPDSTLDYEEVNIAIYDGTWPHPSPAVPPIPTSRVPSMQSSHYYEEVKVDNGNSSGPGPQPMPGNTPNAYAYIMLNKVGNQGDQPRAGIQPDSEEDYEEIDTPPLTPKGLVATSTIGWSSAHDFDKDTKPMDVSQASSEGYAEVWESDNDEKESKTAHGDVTNQKSLKQTENFLKPPEGSYAKVRKIPLKKDESPPGIYSEVAKPRKPSANHEKSSLDHEKKKTYINIPAKGSEPPKDSYAQVQIPVKASFNHGQTADPYANFKILKEAQEVNHLHSGTCNGFKMSEPTTSNR